MTDILEEVLNDQNEEKRLHYFKKMLPVIIICATIIVVVMLFNNWNQSKKIKNAQKIGDTLIKSIEIVESNQDLALESLENLINTDSNRASEIAALEQVGIEISNKNFDNARTLLEKIIQNSRYYDITTAYARISWLSLTMDKDNLSEEDNSNIQKFLSYFDNEELPFFGTAYILKAIWFIKNSKIDDAKKILSQALMLNNTPKLIKDQARALIANLESL